MDAHEVITIVIGVLGGIFLILAIVVAIFIIKIFKTLNQIAKNASGVMRDVENFTSDLYWSVEPLKFIKTIVGFVGSMRDRSKKRSKW